MSEPESPPCGYQEPDWRRWVAPYVPGQPWPWRSDSIGLPSDPAGPGA